MASAKIQRMSKSGKQKTTQKAQKSDVPDEIQCKICKKRYEDPKLLPCLHTFCKACLEQSIEKHNGTLYCPVCPGEINSAEFSGVENLQSNFMVSNLLQAIDLKQGLSSKQCESCEEGVTATSRCFECSDFLCGNCVEAHKRVRFTKNHRVVAIKNLNANAMVKTPTCASHAQETLKMYCKQCKKPVCRPCILSEHEEHILVSLNEAVDETKPKLNALLLATRAKIPILQRKLKGVHTSKEKLESKVDYVIKEIQATSARILMAVKRREKDLYKMLRRIHDQKSDELESRELALEDDLAQVLDSCDFADELGKPGNEAMVLHASEMTCSRLRILSGKDVEEVPEISENEIEYIVDEKLVLDELKIYGKVLSKEQKARKEKNAKDKKKERSGNIANERERKEENETGDQGKQMKHEEQKKATVERKTSWLQTITNPRALIRRLSFGGNEMEDKKPDDSSGSKHQVPNEEDEVDTSQRDNDQEKNDTEQQKQSNKQENLEDTQRKRTDSFSKSTNESEHVYAVPDKTKKQQDTKPDTSTSSPKHPRLMHDPTSPPNEPSSMFLKEPSPMSPKERVLKFSNDPNKPTESLTTIGSPRTHSILKPPSPHDNTEQPELAQAWTVRTGSLPSGAHSQSYLPSLCILTKNRRGRPREVEVQLESPDNSIVSAQILDHKNGTYTIFYCPLTPGEHNLYVNLGGKNIKHGKKVLNFYGKFTGMGTEELFLARRALSCIRWQATPGFVELKDKKLKANPDL